MTTPSQPAAEQLHEFNAVHDDDSLDVCGIAVSGVDICGQPRSAAIHHRLPTANEPHEFQYANVSNGLCWCGEASGNPIHRLDRDAHFLSPRKGGQAISKDKEATMTQDKHRETALRNVERWIAVSRPNLIELNQLNTPDLVESFTTALATTEADAYARGRDEAKAEDAEIALKRKAECLVQYDRFNRPGFESQKGSWFSSAEQCEIIHNAILASSPGPAIESRIRAEIAEVVATVPGYITIGDIGRAKTLSEFRDDVLAAIASDGSFEKAIRQRIEREILDEASEVGDALSVVRGERDDNVHGQPSTRRDYE